MIKIQHIRWTLAICLISLGGLITASVLHMLILLIVLAVICISAIILTFSIFSKVSAAKEEELIEMKVVLEKKEKSIADFSHKIRTPLNNFSTIIDVILETNPERQQKELLETLIASTSNIITVLNDLTVDTAREISFEPRKSINFNLVDTIQNTIELFDLKPDNHLLISVSAEDGFVSSLYGDPISIKQIFLDIFNGVDTDESDKLDINIGISAITGSKGNYNVSFSFKSSRPIQFFKYNPEDNSPTDSLAVKLIVKMGGHITLSPTLSSSALNFNIPFSKPVEEIKMSDAALRIRELKSEIKEKKGLSEANILLVEDNLFNQKIIKISLTSKVKNIDVASNGKEALDMFGTANYDLILMDVQLPIMDGIRAVQKIRELEASTSKHTPIIAVTANAMLGDKEKCLSAGMDEYLSKPFQPLQLISLIEELISR